MYLVSLYFDDKSHNKIQTLINKAAVEGNSFMIDGKVPPHITISAFQSNKEELIIEKLNKKMENIKSGNIMWASIGVFKSSVVFLAPVLNEYLHNLCVDINESISSIDDALINKYYLPFQWMPHTTIAKKLNKEQVIPVFQKVEKSFNMFNGKAVRIALSKTNPHEDVKVWKI